MMCDRKKLKKITNKKGEIVKDFSPKNGILFEKGTDEFIIELWYKRNSKN